MVSLLQRGIMENKKSQWSSHISFIIATVGSAVGLGNIWRFPYIMGKNGGAVFLVTYLLIIAFICIVPLCCELGLGKLYKKDTVSTFKQINPKFEPAGWLCIITVILIPCFYFVVGGWILNYIWIFLTNNLPSNFAQYFSAFSSQTIMPCLLTILFLLLTAYFPYKGVNGGIEKANNIMMPLFFVMLVVLSIFALTLSGAKEGLNFMFHPDFTLFNKNMILTALGQALFTLSIGMGTILTYGSYMKEDTNILKSGYTLIICDTIIALLAGIMIFPIVFSFNVEPSAGATLAFITMPQMFAKLPFSTITGFIFFVLLFFASITSGISMMEAAICTFITNFKFSRKKSALMTSLLIALISIPASLSFGILSDFHIFNKTIFDFLDYLTSNLLLPFNTLFLCIMCGWCIGDFCKKIFKNGFSAMTFNILLKFIIPIVLIFVLISSL